MSFLTVINFCTSVTPVGKVLALKTCDLFMVLGVEIVMDSSFLTKNWGINKKSYRSSRVSLKKSHFFQNLLYWNGKSLWKRDIHTNEWSTWWENDKTWYLYVKRGNLWFLNGLYDLKCHAICINDILCKNM